MVAFGSIGVAAALVLLAAKIVLARREGLSNDCQCVNNGEMHSSNNDGTLYCCSEMEKMKMDYGLIKVKDNRCKSITKRISKQEFDDCCRGMVSKRSPMAGDPGIRFSVCGDF
ncbi:MAG: hypothetical protein M1837_006588 [Sclerophora amabilis]|nr:MAG: hypothetical protein M1837_006588 [Sclerophora amabilis]